MHLTTGRIHDAVTALNAIIQSPTSRKIPAMGKYRLARMHNILEREYVLIEAERSKLVMELGEEVFSDVTKTTSLGWQVQQSNIPKFTEYVKRWNELRSQEIEVNVHPISLYALGNDPAGVEMDEFKALGELIEEPSANTDMKSLTPV